MGTVKKMTFGKLGYPKTYMGTVKEMIFGKLGYPKTYMGTVKQNDFWEIRVSQNIYGNRNKMT